MESGALAAREWITLPERPTAVFCSCDEVAFGFNSALYRNGFRVPRDVSVVGFDDVPLAEFSIPLDNDPATTSGNWHPSRQIALKLIQNPHESPESVYLKGDLIIRESAHRFQN